MIFSEMLNYAYVMHTVSDRDGTLNILTETLYDCTRSHLPDTSILRL